MYVTLINKHLQTTVVFLNGQVRSFFKIWFILHINIINVKEKEGSMAMVKTRFVHWHFLLLNACLRVKLTEVSNCHMNGHIIPDRFQLRT